MSKLEELIQELCPNGVEFVPLWSITAWDKKFNAVDKAMQPKVYKYPVLLAKDLFAMQQEKGDVFLLSTGTETGWTTEKIAGDYLCKGEVVTLPWGKSSPVKGLIKYYNGKFVTGDNRIATSLDTEKLLNKYLYYWMVNQGDVIDTFYRGSGIKHPSMFHVLTMTIPVPPMEVQREIVRLLDDFTAKTAELQDKLNEELEARKKQYKYYRDSLFNDKLNDLSLELCLDGIQWKKIGELADYRRGSFPQPYGNKEWYDGEGSMPFVQVADIGDNLQLVSDTNKKISTKAQPKSVFAPKGTVVVSLQGTIGRVAITQYDAFIDRTVAIFQNLNSSVNTKYFVYQLQRIFEGKAKNARGSTIKTITKAEFTEFLLPIPPLEVQEEIVRLLDDFTAKTTKLQDKLNEELEIRKKQYEYYRDKLLTFKELNESEVN